MKKRIVITGISAVCAIGDDIEEINTSLRNLKSGVKKKYIDGVGEYYVGAVDAKIYNDNKNLLDRTTQFAIYCIPGLLENASFSLKNIEPHRVSTIVSSSKAGIISIINAYDEFLKNKNSKLISDYLKSYNGINVSEEVARTLDITGPRLNYPAACATGLVSIIQGANLIREGYADVVIAGSSEASIQPLIIAGFEQAGVLSKEICKPFNKNRSGFNIGEGCAIFLLEEYESAKKRNAPIIAEIAGYSFGGDAYHITSFEPSGETISYNIRKAIAMAGMSISDIEYINAHGTGTPQNDKVETAAIKKAFGEYAYSIPISSLKPYIGHLLGASGSVELAASFIAVMNEYLPPTLFLDERDEECDLQFIPLNIIEKKISTFIKLSYGFGGHIGVLVLKRVEK